MSNRTKVLPPRALALCCCAALAPGGCEAASPIHHPGPCSAVRTVEAGPTTTCAIDYDARGRRVSARCAIPEWQYTQTIAATYDGDRLSRLSYLVAGTGGSASYVWTRSAGEVTEAADLEYASPPATMHVDRVYEGDAFALVGHPSDPEAQPDAPDGLLSSHSVRTDGDPDDPLAITTVDVTYEYDGSRTAGTRVRTGSDGSTRRFTYDSEGRLMSDAEGERVIAYEYDGDLLVAIRDADDVVFSHDEHGNLVAKTGPAPAGVSGTMFFDYGCW